jgi:hypothetical protein
MVEGRASQAPRALRLRQGAATTELEAGFRKALEIARRQEAKPLELRAATSLARCGQSVTALPLRSDVNLLGDGERVIDLDAEVPDRALDLGMAKEQLNRPKIAGTPIDQRRLGSFA